jgi:hypothetical protein
MKSSVLVNCPWGSARSCCVAFVHFFICPLAARCRASTYVLPFQSPSQWSSVQWGKSAIPVNHRGALYAPIMRPPFTFCCIYTAWFWASPRARAGPRAAAVKDEGIGLPGKLGKALHAIILLPDPRFKLPFENIKFLCERTCPKPGNTMCVYMIPRKSQEYRQWRPLRWGFSDPLPPVSSPWPFSNNCLYLHPL